MIAKILIPTLAVFAPTMAAAQSGQASNAPAVQVWLNDHGSYEQGDRMRIFFEANRDAYVTVVRVTTEGNVRILFPETPVENNYVAGGSEYEVIQYGRNDYRIHDEPGHGYVFAVASAQPFGYGSFTNGPVWDYHLLDFENEGEEDRDPYDTFAHFMDDILAPDSEDFNYQSIAYSVDERNERYYANTYRYYSAPRYHDCHVYRAFWGLRPSYVYDYDCRRVGVTIILGSNGHYYHNDYYHYGYYTGSIPYYYGYGSIYRYRYDSGHYRHNHGARRVTQRALSGYQGVVRHSQPNGGGIQGRRTVGSSGSPAVNPRSNGVPGRRTTTSGSPVRRSPVARGGTRDGGTAAAPANSTPRRRATTTGSTANSGRNNGTPRRRTTTTTNSGTNNATPRRQNVNEQNRRVAREEVSTPRRRLPDRVRPTPSPRSNSGNLTRRRSGSSSGSARASSPPRRQATPSARPRTTNSRPSAPRRSASAGASRPRSTTRSAPRPSSGRSSARPAPSRSSGRSAPRRSSGSGRRPG